MVKVGINGFGRIGRVFFRMAMEDPDIDVCMINDPFMDTDQIEYLIKYDTVHGKFGGEIHKTIDALIVNGSTIKTFKFKNPEEIKWGENGVDYVVECTGVFTSHTAASRHLSGGAKRIIISAPSDTAPHVVIGVNHKEYDPKTHFVVSNASCTTNCLAPLAKIIHEKYEITEGIMTTVHSVTSTQKTVDSQSGRDWRSGRCSLQNIIPTSTGATSSVIKVIPELKGKLTGTSFRVPLANVSVVDLTCKIRNAACLDDIRNHIKKMAECPEYHGIIGYTDEQVVSSDFVGDTRSCIFDSDASIALNDNFVKLIAWYDNEAGYSKRLVDLIKYMHFLEK